MTDEAAPPLPDPLPAVLVAACAACFIGGGMGSFAPLGLDAGNVAMLALGIALLAASRITGARIFLVAAGVVWLGIPFDGFVDWVLDDHPAYSELTLSAYHLLARVAVAAALVASRDRIGRPLALVGAVVFVLGALTLLFSSFALAVFDSADDLGRFAEHARNAWSQPSLFVALAALASVAFPPGEGVEKGRALHLLGGIGALLFAMVLLLTTEITHARGHDAEHVILPWVFFHLVATVLVACGHAGQARAGDGRFAWVGLALVLSPLAICPLLGVGGDGVVRYFLPMVLSFAWLGSGRALLRAPAGTAPVLGNVAGATLIVAFALAALATVLAWISLLFEARLPGDLALGLIPRFVDSATLGYALAAVWFLRRLGTR